MKLSKLFVPLLALPLMLIGNGCETTMDHEDHMEAMHEHMWESVTEAVAVMQPTAGNKATGTVHFTQMGNKVHVVATITGLNPNRMHAIHIHEAGDISAKDGTATGGHYNPEGHQHGLMNMPMRHAGDLGNLQSDSKGEAKLDIMVDNISVAGMKNPIIGRGVIIHAKQDDGGQPTGNAGGRISQGVIGIVKTAK